MGAQIGAGAYACVRAAWVKDSGDRVAVKVYEKSSLNRESRRRNVYREVHVLAKVRHKHIIGFREWFATDRRSASSRRSAKASGTATHCGSSTATSSSTTCFSTATAASRSSTSGLRWPSPRGRS